MKNTGGTPRDKWKRVGNVLSDPMTLIPMVLGILFVFMTFTTTEDILRTIYTVISAIGLGLGINHFTFFYKKETEERTLRFKAEATVRQLNTTIKSIIRKEQLDKTDLDTIDRLVDSIDYWKDYYPEADTVKLLELTSLKVGLQQNPDNKEIITNINLIERNLIGGPIESFVTLSGNTSYQQTRVLKNK